MIDSVFLSEFRR